MRNIFRRRKNGQAALVEKDRCVSRTHEPSIEERAREQAEKDEMRQRLLRLQFEVETIQRKHG